jgi:peptide-methionine (S)-S-oxide reductase
MKKIFRRIRQIRPGLLLTMVIPLAILGGRVSTSSAEEVHAIPAAVVDEPVNPQATSEVAVLAGGCFWGVQGVFQHVAGVTSAVSGYAGGGKLTAHYEIVSTGTTGHAESVRITFDPHRISYGRILQIYFSVAHDPTELNAQGPDEGTQYRSAIFPMNAQQSHVAQAYITQLTKAHAFSAPIVTKIEPDRAFYPAEDHHQDFLARNPDYPYIVINDLPKIDHLKQIYPAMYSPTPVLVEAVAH